MVCQPLGGMQLKCHPCSPPNKTIPISHGDWSVQWALPDPKMQRVSQTAVTTRPVSPKDSERLVDSRPQKKKLISSQSVTDQPQSPQLKMIGWIIWFDTCTYQYVHTYTLYVLICAYISIHIIYIYRYIIISYDLPSFYMIFSKMSLFRTFRRPRRFGAAWSPPDGRNDFGAPGPTLAVSAVFLPSKLGI
jgi:hypothetical protein